MKKNVLFIGISVSLLILLGIGVSYSMWNMSNSQDTENVISTTECFDIAITSQENSISLKNSYPISDEKGKSLTPFTFRVTNTCDMSAAYSVNLESLKGSTLSSSFLKVMVNDKVPKMLNEYDNVSTVNNSSVEARVLDTGTLFKNKSKEYQVRLWIDYDTTMEDLDNETKVLKSKIVVTGSPTNEEEPSPVLLTDTVKVVSNSNTVDTATDDPDNNIRYIGKEPYNYVYFNCSDYNNQSDSTCEKWRIIGLFNNITKGDGSKENLVKIIRNERLNDTNIRWDYKQSGVGTSISNSGSNDWIDSQLMMMLNPTTYLKPGYTNSSDIISSGSQQIYSKMGSYYNGTKGCLSASATSGSAFSCTEVDFTSTGLKNDTTRNAIEEVVWNLGGTDALDTSTASMFYTAERSTIVYSGHATTWTGKIGLMYPSDYGYATAGGSTIERSTCLSYSLYNWYNSSYSDCKNNDYLYKSSYVQWTLAPYSGRADGVLYVNSRGGVYGTYVYSAYGVRPTLYLKSNIIIKDGNGSSNSPYQLGL